MFAIVFCAANPIITAAIPAPASRDIENVLNPGISIRMKIAVIPKSKLVIKIFRNSSLVFLIFLSSTDLLFCAAVKNFLN